MTASFPTSVPSYSNPAGTDTVDNVDHAAQHANVNDDVEALAAKVGTGSSTPATVGQVLQVTGSGASAHQIPRHNIQTYTPTGGGTATLDLSKGLVHHITMPAGNITIALSNAATGMIFQIDITQDSTGSRTVTWFSTIRWAGGSAPTLTTTANKRDSLILKVTGSNTYDGYIAGQNI